MNTPDATPPPPAALPAGFPTLAPEQIAAMREMAAYTQALQQAQAEGGSREAILAILQASEPPSVAAGGMHRMSFGLEYLLEASGNGRAKWWAFLSDKAEARTADSAATVMETLFIFHDPDGALRALGLNNDLLAFRMAANQHARQTPAETVNAVTAWMIQEMLRYWNLLPFLELAAKAMEGAQPAKRDGSQPSLTTSAPTTEPVSTRPSGDGAPTLSAHCGLRLSNAGEENTPAPDLRTEPPPPPPGTGGIDIPPRPLPPSLRQRAEAAAPSLPHLP